MTHLRVHFNNNKVAQSRFVCKEETRLLKTNNGHEWYQHIGLPHTYVIGIRNESRCVSTSIIN